MTAVAGPGPFTVFAPTNEAFAQIPPQLLQYLLEPQNKADLVRVLTYHVTGSKILAADLTQGEEILTLEGGHLRVTLYNKIAYINFAEVTAADNFASNGSALVPLSMLLRLVILTFQALCTSSTVCCSPACKRLFPRV